MSKPCAIVVGAESTGLGEDWNGLLDEDWNGLLDETVKIPMHGISDSMNVNIAASIFLYEALRCRRG